jgi:hypothetical protein
MSERSARRLKKIVQIYNEQNWIVSNLLFGLVFYYAVQYSLWLIPNVEVTLILVRS